MSGGRCPEPAKDAYGRAADLAWDRLLERDLDDVARASGAHRSGRSLSVRTFGRECIVDADARSMHVGGRTPGPLAQIVVLHYLAGAREISPRGTLVSFRQLPGGEAYHAAFRTRVIDGISEAFLDRPHLLLRAGESIGAVRAPYGDAAIRIDAFPRLPLTVILWRGDEEVRGEANLLFDETAPLHMSTEDLAAMGSLVLMQLTEARRAIEQEVIDHGAPGPMGPQERDNK